jgi:sugar (pentulose or hexulose) kinase
MPSVVWNDGRAPRYQEEFAEEISPEDYQTHTGMQLSPLWPAAKIAWLRDDNPEVFGRARWFATARSTSCTAWAPTSGSPTPRR